MKLIKLSATALGGIVTLFSLNSCAKKQECCTIKYSESTYAVDSKFCEDGTIESTIVEDGYTYSYNGNWNEDDDQTWDELKSYGSSYAVSYNGTFKCEDEKI